MQQRNLIIFLVLAAALIFSWPWVSRLIWGPPQPQGKTPAAKDGGHQTSKPPPKPARPTRPPTGPHGDGALVQLGDDSTKLKVVLDGFGAGVRSVVLNQFPQANYFGKPDKEDGKTLPQELIRADQNLYLPSYALYHYPDEQADRPLPTLGQVRWELVEPGQPEPGRSYSKVVFAANVRDIRITKTFSLDKDAYHIGLEVKIERRATVTPETAATLVAGRAGGLPLAALAQAAVPTKVFRYQIAGPHGTRLEGEWYARTHRDAMILKVGQAGDDPLRTTEDLRRLSHREGGDEVLRTNDRFIRYGGVAVQFFACLVVVDDQQAEGVGQNFLARARPTLETAWVHGKVVGVNRDLRTIDLDTTPEAGLFDFSSRRQVVQKIFVPPSGAGAEDMLAGVHEGERLVANCYTDAYDRRVAVEVVDQANANRLFFDDITVRLTTEPIKLEPGKPVVHRYLLYNGPVKVALLGDLQGDKAVPPELVQRYRDTLQLRTLTDYHSNSVFGEIANTIGWTRLLIFFTNLMHTVLYYLHQVIPNYGLCILVLTILVRACMFPLSRKQTLASQRMQEKMKRLQPEINRLKEKYKDDPQMLRQEQTALMLRSGVHGGMLGTCWIALLQMPIFMGLYFALQESIHFRLAPFIIPGWIENLAAPDMLFYWTQSIPLVSSPDNYNGFWSFLYLGPYFNLLPVIAVAFMLLQQQMMQPPATDEQTAQQQKMMKYMMVLFGLFFYKVAAGLCLYFIASSLWGFTERKLLAKKKAQIAAAPETEEGGRLWRWAMDRLQVQREAIQGTPPAGAAPTLPAPADGAKGRGKAKGKGKRPGRPQPESNGSPKGGWLGKLRQWWQEVLKEAQRKNR